VTRFRFILVFGAVLLVGSACADVTSDAIRVNEETLSHSDVDDMLTQVQDELNELDDPSIAEFQLPDGTMSAAVASQVLTFVIRGELLGQILEEEGTSMSDEDIAAFVPQAELSTGLATFDRLQAELLAGLSLIDPATADEALSSADIEVDPQYGVWVEGQVVPNSLAAQ
jgi:hypothetical protein